MSDKKVDPKDLDNLFYNYHGQIDFDKLATEAVAMQTQEAEIQSQEVEQAPVKSEKDRMGDFFRGHSKEDSEIILRGYCPKCHEKGFLMEWKPVGIGYKECTRCEWRDY